LKQVLRLLSRGIRQKAKARKVTYSFVFMHADGAQLSAITSLIESGIIKPVIDRTFPLEATAEAMTYVDSGRAKGKVAIRIK
jgi:NADPH:quinone reductase-like Zn-dependent oxidoreductase